jgi:hypothetical protein
VIKRPNRFLRAGPSEAAHRKLTPIPGDLKSSGRHSTVANLRARKKLRVKKGCLWESPVPCVPRQSVIHTGPGTWDLTSPSQQAQDSRIASRNGVVRASPLQRLREATPQKHQPSGQTFSEKSKFGVGAFLSQPIPDRTSGVTLGYGSR